MTALNWDQGLCFQELAARLPPPRPCRHDDPRRPQQPAIELVARLHHLQHRIGRRVRRRCISIASCREGSKR